LVDKQGLGLLGNEVPFVSFAFREIVEAVFVGSKHVQLMTICFDHMYGHYCTSVGKTLAPPFLHSEPQTTTLLDLGVLLVGMQ